MLRLEVVLNKHQSVAVERGLFEMRPSQPKEEIKEGGGRRVMGSERKMILGELGTPPQFQQRTLIVKRVEREVCQQSSQFWGGRRRRKPFKGLFFVVFLFLRIGREANYQRDSSNGSINLGLNWRLGGGVFFGCVQSLMEDKRGERSGISKVQKRAVFQNREGLEVSRAGGGILSRISK